jgi:hypothetical protein
MEENLNNKKWKTKKKWKTPAKKNGRQPPKKIEDDLKHN